MRLSLLFFAATALLGLTSDPGLRLTVRRTNLVNAVIQPVAGIWNLTDNSLEITSDAASGLLMAYCGPNVIVTFPTQTGYLYECQASDDGLRSWQGSNLRVIGTGTPVSLYDVPRPARSYRIARYPR